MDISSTTYQSPQIVKYIAHHRSGIQPYNIRRHGIGFVLHGTKHIYDGDIRQQIKAGEVFMLGIGNHYIEDIPERDRPFEQIIFYYAPERLNKIITDLNLSYGIGVANTHSCRKCRDTAYVVGKTWQDLTLFFKVVCQYIDNDMFSNYPAAEDLRMTELVYMILCGSDNCLRSKLLAGIDSTRENFEQIVNRNIFTAASIEELAALCNRSLTAFKKDFKKHFGESPHKWLNRQRLMYARLQLISTSKSIAQIGNECTYPNASHFIKLFKKEFGMTPAAYRRIYSTRESAEGGASEPAVVERDYYGDTI